MGLEVGSAGWVRGRPAGERVDTRVDKEAPAPTPSAQCVPNDDIKTSSYAKARGIFLDAVGAPGAVATLKGSDDAEVTTGAPCCRSPGCAALQLDVGCLARPCWLTQPPCLHPCTRPPQQAEAAAYAKALAASADADGMERAPSGAPRFDLLLLGVGSDGHVGSLYPGGEATLADPAAAPWVQPVVKAKPPASITLSLGVMNAARSVIVRRVGQLQTGGTWVPCWSPGQRYSWHLRPGCWHHPPTHPPQVCLTGASKAAAAKTALETAVPRGDFPAQLVQPDLSPAVWLLDEASAAELALVKGGSGDGKSSGGGGAQGGKGQPQSDGSILFTF